MIAPLHEDRGAEHDQNAGPHSGRLAAQLALHADHAAANHRDGDLQPVLMVERIEDLHASFRELSVV